MTDSNVLALDYMPKHLWHKCEHCEDTYGMGTKNEIPICFNCDRPMKRSEDPLVEYSQHNQRARGF